MNLDKLESQLKKLGVRKNVQLAQYTTWKVGGPADLFLEVDSTDDLIMAVKEAHKHAVPVTVLGWGSNVLISDEGIRGLIVRNKSSRIDIKGECKHPHSKKATHPRLVQVDTENYYSFSEVDYEESETQLTEVVIDSGVSLQLAINKLINEGLTGLQWFSGIPGTIGGAIINNIHGGTHFIEEYVGSVEILTASGDVEALSHDKLGFDYDSSRFQNSDEVVLRVTFCLHRGDKDKAKKAAVEWATKKQLQPHNTAGCCFQNITPEKQTELKLESNGWGYIIDQVLNLKGKSIGGAMISPKHAAFIENTGGATAQDILGLFELIFIESEKTLGITPKAEIFFLGFPDEVVRKFR
ncbi:MAG: UDP-N-acetylmuramate dehydrogenase [Candidatus Dojkabacteria bacterium]